MRAPCRGASKTHADDQLEPHSLLEVRGRRIRAARDLLSRIPLANASHVYDLVAGPSNSPELLLRRFGDAKVVGLDASNAMLAVRACATAGSIPQQNIALRARDRPDLIFANAALQFLPDHDRLLPRLILSCARRDARGPDAERGERSLACAHAHGRGQWSLVIAPGADRQDPAPHRRLRGLLRLAPALRLAGRCRSEHVHPLDGPHSIADWFAGSTCSRSWSGSATTSVVNFSLATAPASRRPIRSNPTAVPCSPTRGFSSSQ